MPLSYGMLPALSTPELQHKEHLWHSALSLDKSMPSALLQKALVSARLGHAYLFYGPSGVGKKLTACSSPKPWYARSATAEACDRCASCHTITTGNHPDVVVINPEGTSIRIEHIRAMQRQLGYKPYESQRTVVIIDGCESLTSPAANALLKTLEEPPASALLLLLTSKKDALPLTIISRCQQIPFRPLAPAHIQAILIQQGVDQSLLQSLRQPSQKDVWIPGCRLTSARVLPGGKTPMRCCRREATPQVCLSFSSLANGLGHANSARRSCIGCPCSAVTS